MPPLYCEPLPPRDCPTVLQLDYAADWWTPPRRNTAEAVAAELSAKVDVPGFDSWRVRLDYDPATPVIAYATGIGGWGYVHAGPAAESHDLATVLRHELVHALGVLDHAEDPDAVLWYGLRVGEGKQYTSADDELLRAGGLSVAVPAQPKPQPPAPPPPPVAAPPQPPRYTFASHSQWGWRWLATTALADWTPHGWLPLGTADALPPLTSA